MLANSTKHTEEAVVKLRVQGSDKAQAQYHHTSVPIKEIIKVPISEYRGKNAKQQPKQSSHQ